MGCTGRGFDSSSFEIYFTQSSEHKSFLHQVDAYFHRLGAHLFIPNLLFVNLIFRQVLDESLRFGNSFPFQVFLPVIC